MIYDYNNCIWGKNTATLKRSDPTSIRLKRVLEVLSKLPENSKILEVGCGAGSFIGAVSKMRPDLKCFGCDISIPAIDMAINQYDGATFSLCDKKSLPYENNYFDAVIVIDVIEHVEQPKMLLSQINRILKKGGIFFAFVPCENDWISWWKYLNFFGLKKDITKKYAGHINFFSRKDLYKLFSESNFFIQKKSYSEHVLGQLLGIASFMAMNHYAKKKSMDQINNEIFFHSINSKKGWRNSIRVLINNLINFESSLFRRIPSPNVFVTSVK